MKKILTMVAVAMMTALSVNAQSAGTMFVKPMVGGALTTLTGDGIEDAKMKFGLVAGGEFGYHFTENMAVTAGLLYSMQGAGSKDVDDKLKMDYLNIPVLFNYYVAPGLAIKAGVQPGFLLSSKFGDVDMKDHTESFDLSIPLGLSYEISDFVIDARYNLGVTNVAKSAKGDVTDGKSRNSVIMLTLGYKVSF